MLEVQPRKGNQIYAPLILPLFLQMTCWLLLTHLSYHILAHRIKHLNLYLSDLGDFPTRVSQSENVVSLNAETAAVAVPNRLFILFFL